MYESYLVPVDNMNAQSSYSCFRAVQFATQSKVCTSAYWNTVVIGQGSPMHEMH
jgi:hypothetical protein